MQKTSIPSGVEPKAFKKFWGQKKRHTHLFEDAREAFAYWWEFAAYLSVAKIPDPLSDRWRNGFITLLNAYVYPAIAALDLSKSLDVVQDDVLQIEVADFSGYIYVEARLEVLGKTILFTSGVGLVVDGRLTIFPVGKEQEKDVINSVDDLDEFLRRLPRQ